MSILDLKKRRLTLLGDVNEDMLLKTLLSLDALEAKSTTLPITITLSSCGGDAYDCLGVYDRIKSSPCPITIIGIGPVMSSGTIILQAAKRRLLMENVRFMIHYGSIELNEQSAIDATAYVDFEKAFDRPFMEDVYLTGIKRVRRDFTRTQIKKLLSKDTFMTANQAVEIGLADGIYTKKTRTKKKRKQ